MNEKLEALRGALPRLTEGLEITLQLTLGGATLAFLISVVFGLLSLSPVGPLPQSQCSTTPLTHWA